MKKVNLKKNPVMKYKWSVLKQIEFLVKASYCTFGVVIRITTT